MDPYTRLFPSPDGSKQAVFRDVSEIAMGGPETGSLTIDGAELDTDPDQCFFATGGWSGDSRYFVTLLHDVEPYGRSRFALYDTKTHMLELDRRPTPVRFGYKIASFEAAIRQARQARIACVLDKDFAPEQNDNPAQSRTPARADYHPRRGPLGSDQPLNSRRFHMLLIMLVVGLLLLTVLADDLVLAGLRALFRLLSAV